MRLSWRVPRFMEEDEGSMTDTDLLRVIKAALDEADARGRVVERQRTVKVDPAGNDYETWWEVLGLPARRFDTRSEAELTSTDLRLQIITRAVLEWDGRQ